VNEGASSEQIDCAVGYIKDHFPYSGDKEQAGFWFPPVKVMLDAGKACT
jgi:hypothetical protein